MPYYISADPSKLDLAYIHAQLSASYWSPGIPREVVEAAIAGSMCFGLYLEDRQVGFARFITDGATFGYLADVFVDEAHRGKGLGKMLVGHILELPLLAGLRRIMLATRDAHSLYAQFGFTPLQKPDRFMEIARPNIYQNT